MCLGAWEGRRTCGKGKGLFPSLPQGQPHSSRERLGGSKGTIFCEILGLGCASVQMTTCDTALWSGVFWPFLSSHVW